MRHFPRARTRPDSTPLVGLRIGSNTRLGREIYRGIFRYTRTHTRWRLVIDASNHPSRTTLPRCDAYIAAVWTEDIADWAKTLRGPVVNVSSRCSVPRCLQVRVDDDRIGRLAANHFLDRSLRRFGYVGPNNEPQARARLAGFEQELGRRNLQCDRFDWRLDTGGFLDWSALLAWLKSRPFPMAIFCNNDETGRLVTQACWETGVSVPEQALVLGVDNDEVFCEASQPPLSSIDVGADRIGETAARCLDEVLLGRSPTPRDLRVPPVSVLERASTDLIAIDDPDIAAALRFIRERACDGINVDDVLRETGLKRRLLERRFQDLLGRSPLQHIHRAQLSRAEDLLINTTLPLKVVAAKSGFRLLQTFHRVFSSHHARSPGAFRKDARLAGSAPA